jgi:hypothetical protein
MSRLFLVCAVVGMCGVQSRAADEAVTAAVAKGAAYLQKVFATPEACENDTFKTGSVALAGLALLEAGVKPDDRALVNITNYVRKTAITQTETYHFATTILFLDKLAEKTESTTDHGLIQLMGVRLYAGMNAGGGWGYTSWEPVSEVEEKRWKSALEIAAKPTEKLHPEVARLHALVVQTVQARGRTNDLGDNSNTQFGMIGLWVASRYGVPANDAFAAVERRFLANWHKEGGWGYRMDDAASSMSMTCAGLLGLAVGEASRVPEPKVEKPKAPPIKDDPFFNPKKPADVRKPVGNATRADIINKAILGLGQAMSSTNNAKLPRGRDEVLTFMQPYVGAGTTYYMLWSIERCAVAYGLDSFGDNDWYTWGCNILFKLQAPEGCWVGGTHTESINTSFAILFLMKANSFRDLTSRLAGRVKDPGTQELRGSVGAKPLFSPTEKPAVAVEPKKDPSAGPGSFPLPAPMATTEIGEVEKAVQQLLALKDADWPTKLAAVRDGKGSNFTQILVQIAALSEGERKKLSREYLAERLTRMTAKTLREMMQDIEPELRRAACLACGMKELNESIPWMIARISDPSEAVVRAAQASLKSLGGVDHGPPSGADAETKLKAATAWREWYEKRGK